MQPTTHEIETRRARARNNASAIAFDLHVHVVYKCARTTIISTKKTHTAKKTKCMLFEVLEEEAFVNLTKQHYLPSFHHTSITVHNLTHHLTILSFFLATASQVSRYFSLKWFLQLLDQFSTKFLQKYNCMYTSSMRIGVYLICLNFALHCFIVR